MRPRMCKRDYRSARVNYLGRALMPLRTKGTQTRFQAIPWPMADFATGTTRHAHAPVSTEPRHETGGASPVHTSDLVTEPVWSTPSPWISSGRTLASQESEASATSSPGGTTDNPGEAWVTRPTGQSPGQTTASTVVPVATESQRWATAEVVPPATG